MILFQFDYHFHELRKSQLAIKSINTILTIGYFQFVFPETNKDSY